MASLDTLTGIWSATEYREAPPTATILGRGGRKRWNYNVFKESDLSTDPSSDTDSCRGSSGGSSRFSSSGSCCGTATACTTADANTRNRCEQADAANSAGGVESESRGTVYDSDDSGTVCSDGPREVEEYWFQNRFGQLFRHDLPPPRKWEVTQFYYYSGI